MHGKVTRSQNDQVNEKIYNFPLIHRRSNFENFGKNQVFLKKSIKSKQRYSSPTLRVARAGTRLTVHRSVSVAAFLVKRLSVKFDKKSRLLRFFTCKVGCESVFFPQLGLPIRGSNWMPNYIGSLLRGVGAPGSLKEPAPQVP